MMTERDWDNDFDLIAWQAQSSRWRQEWLQEALQRDPDDHLTVIRRQRYERGQTAWDIGRDEAARARARAKAEGIASVSVLVIAYSVPGRNPDETRENYAAVACSLQNLQLAAVEESLVSGWSTDALTHDPGLKSLVGAENDWEIVGALYLGYAAPAPMVAKQRPGAAAFTRWLSE